MAISESYKSFIEDQLTELEGWYAKKMFGGVGYFIDGIIFGFIAGDVFRLKVNDQTKAKYVSLGMEGYAVPGKDMIMDYFQVPDKIVEDKAELKIWSLEALAISIESKKVKKKK